MPGVTFDALVAGHFGAGDDDLDLVKMDVEGAEYEILFSDSATALRRFRSLIIEIHRGNVRPPEELVERIGSFGFERVSVAGDEGAVVGGEKDDDDGGDEVMFFQR